MVEAIPMGRYGLDSMMCNYEEDQLNYGFDSISPGSISNTSSSSRSSSNDDGQIYAYAAVDGMDVKIPQLRKSVNKLGGMYTSGKPLPLSIRREIVAMSETGMKACDISRQLQISHGCVSKIIAKWRSTGSFEPRRIGGSKPKKTLPEVIAAVRMYKRACPSIHSLEIRKRLLADEICTDQNVPSLSSINRIIRMKLRDEVAEFEASAVRDLMAILTGPASDDMECESDPDSRVKDMKREDSVEEPDYSSTPPQHNYQPTAIMDHQSVKPVGIPGGPVDTGCNRADLATCFGPACPPQICMDIAPQPFEPPAVNPTRPEERRQVNCRIPDLFADPYDISLGTPVFHDPNLDANQGHETRPRNLDNSGVVFGFDFDENVWSWLDQMPLS